MQRAGLTGTQRQLPIVAPAPALTASAASRTFVLTVYAARSHEAAVSAANRSSRGLSIAAGAPLFL